ncbi:cytochrome c oxidase subunit 3 [Candidatus Methylobacter oryzae]|uniref:Heme-copper oxidase subunit III n=1 Tax=Candidatus Methylobacter oryzae TaxID=2497749 RepID=A0ABY3CGH9_9GAMM|nr:cytochrome c oxidase subunit 3 [Candidatus Methylobacter oryzae]TRX02893.1 heme-copper oxidase subunit III [Candidatus Methylobacter oryzae]
MAETIPLDRPLPVGSEGRRSGGWWGVLALIATEASLFTYLLFSYFYLASQTEQHWPPEGLPELLVPGVNTAILLTSSVCVWACERCLQRSMMGWSMAWMAFAHILGIIFVAVQLNEWSKKAYGMASNLYGSLYFTITGFHMLHVIVGVVILLVLLLWISLGYFDHRRYAAVTIGGLYWHFVDVVWLFVFTTLYLLPYVG